jgi:hypothetical protein
MSAICRVTYRRMIGHLPVPTNPPTVPSLAPSPATQTSMGSKIDDAALKMSHTVTLAVSHGSIVGPRPESYDIDNICQHKCWGFLAGTPSTGFPNSLIRKWWEKVPPCMSASKKKALLRHYCLNLSGIYAWLSSSRPRPQGQS